MSRLIASFCALHQTDMEAETFSQITDSNMLPMICKTVGFAFLDLERVIVGDKQESDKLSSLQERCVECLHENWSGKDLEFLSNCAS